MSAWADSQSPGVRGRAGRRVVGGGNEQPQPRAHSAVAQHKGPLGLPDLEVHPPHYLGSCLLPQILIATPGASQPWKTLLVYHVLCPNTTVTHSLIPSSLLHSFTLSFFHSLVHFLLCSCIHWFLFPSLALSLHLASSPFRLLHSLTSLRLHSFIGVTSGSTIPLAPICSEDSGPGILKESSRLTQDQGLNKLT